MMKVLKMIGIGLLVLFVVAVLLLVFRFFSEGTKSQSMSPDLGLKNGQLMACPESPNCVSSYETDDIHAITSIQGDSTTLSKLVSYIDSLEGTEIVEQSADYVYATYESGLFGFVDDLELYFDGSVIQVRSASRVGYGDLGANRKRVEALRSAVAGF